MTQIMAAASFDIAHLIEEARHGSLSVPLSELPAFIRALVAPALEEAQRETFVEQHDVVLHRRELLQSEEHREGLAGRSLEYLQAYDAFTATVVDSAVRLDGALSELNDSERHLGARLAELERHAIHLPDGRLAFFERGHFVLEDGSAVAGGDLTACLHAKEQADAKGESVATWHDYSTTKEAIASTVELEQRIAGVAQDISRTGESVRARPPAETADLRKDTAAVKAETDGALAQAILRCRENESLVSNQIEAADAAEQPSALGTTPGDHTASTNFNGAAKALPNRTSLLSSSPTPTPLSLDQVVATAVARPDSAALNLNR